METIRDEKYGRVDVFEPVTEFPYGYSVWNIGREHFPHEKCIPLCKLANNTYSWQMNVDSGNLKYIIVESEELALHILYEASRSGVDQKRFLEILENGIPPKEEEKKVEENHSPIEVKLVGEHWMEGKLYKDKKGRYFVDGNSGEENPTSLYVLCPSDDPDGEPNFRVKVKVIA